MGTSRFPYITVEKSLSSLLPLDCLEGLLILLITAFPVSVPYSTHLTRVCTCQNLPRALQRSSERAISATCWRASSKEMPYREVVEFVAMHEDLLATCKWKCGRQVWQNVAKIDSAQWFNLELLRNGIHFWGQVDVRFNMPAYSGEGWFLVQYLFPFCWPKALFNLKCAIVRDSCGLSSNFRAWGQAAEGKCMQYVHTKSMSRWAQATWALDSFRWF